MKISIESIEHSKQRYPTAGDWFFDKKGNLHIKVSRLGDWRMEALVAVHELVEALLCNNRGITQEQVDRFDMQFEDERVCGIHALEDEPGDDKNSPYRDEHCIATAVERLLCAELGLAWNDYDAKIQALP